MATRRTPFNKLHLRDVRDLPKVLSQDQPCVDVIVTSPPYWDLKDYGAPNQIGHGQTEPEYLADMEQVLRDCYIVTKPTGSLWLVVDTYRHKGELRLLPMELAERACKAGWKLRDVIIWDKQHSIPWHQKGQLRNVFEFILFLSKTDQYKYEIDRIKTLDELSKWWVDFPERFNPKGKTPGNIWSFPIRTQGEWGKRSELYHSCPFPTALAARIIELTTDPGDLVMDPFAGSGVVLAQAHAMGRSYIGFEINPDYVEMFELVVKGEVAAEWEDLKQWRETQATAREDFEQSILKLRVLKYTRKVANAFIDEFRATPNCNCRIRTVVCLADIPNEYIRGWPIEVKILLVVDGDNSRIQVALAKAEERQRRPPLTHFGVQGRIQVYSSEDILQHIAGDQTMYLYPKYQPRKHCGQDSLSNWLAKRLSAYDNTKVPMLANIEVDIAWVLQG
jgi:DNA modification methylase